MSGSGAAIAEKHELSGIVAALDRRLADQVRHMSIDDFEGTCCSFRQRHF